MTYDFRCDHCDLEQEVEIALEDYDRLKDKQICPICYRQMQRKISVFIDRPKSDGRGFFGTN